MVAKWRHGLSFQYCRQSAAKINALLIGCLGRGRQWTLAVRKHDTRTVAQREDIGVIGCRQIRVYDDLPEPAVVQAIYRSDKLGRTHPGRPEFDGRSEEHTSELQSLMRISYAVFCLKKKKKNITIKD